MLSLTARAWQAALLPDLTPAGEAAVVADLRVMAKGRADLLAEAAGLLVGVHEAAPDAAIAARASRMCIEAGADQDEIPAWIEEGRRRRGGSPGNRRTGQ